MPGQAACENYQAKLSLLRGPSLGLATLGPVDTSSLNQAPKGNAHQP